jgi:hypothetical protein
MGHQYDWLPGSQLHDLGQVTCPLSILVPQESGYFPSPLGCWVMNVGLRTLLIKALNSHLILKMNFSEPQWFDDFQGLVFVGVCYILTYV